jgi:hypothetical protein
MLGWRCSCKGRRGVELFLWWKLTPPTLSMDGAWIFQEHGKHDALMLENMHEKLGSNPTMALVDEVAGPSSMQTYLPCKSSRDP